MKREDYRIHVRPDTQLPGISPYITAGFDGRPTLGGRSTFSHGAAHTLHAAGFVFVMASFFFYHYDRKLLENTEIQVHRRVKLIKQN